MIWDITEMSELNKQRKRSNADFKVSRVRAKIDNKGFRVIRSKFEPMHFENRNGSDLYFYPAFLILINEEMKMELIEYSDMEVSYAHAQTLEPETVFVDTEVIGKGWMKENKDGTRDKRFVDNLELPKVSYGMITFESITGLKEIYLVSSKKNAEAFHDALEEFRNLAT
jgi:hypothetical protein